MKSRLLPLRDAAPPRRAACDTVPVPQRIDLLSLWHTRIYIGFRLAARTRGFAAPLEKYPAAWSLIDDTGRWMWESCPTGPVSLRPVQCEAGE